MGQAQLCWGSAHPAYSYGALAKPVAQKSNPGFGFFIPEAKQKNKTKKNFRAKKYFGIF